MDIKNIKDIKDIRIGTQEYSKLSDENKLLVVKLEILRLFNDKSGKLIEKKMEKSGRKDINRRRKVRTIPQNKEDFYKSLIETEKHLIKRTKTDFSIDDIEQVLNSEDSFSILLSEKMDAVKPATNDNEKKG